jgi:hypothetical protein
MITLKKNMDGCGKGTILFVDERLEAKKTSHIWFEDFIGSGFIKSQIYLNKLFK